jgi:hypothetical protein
MINDFDSDEMSRMDGLHRKGGGRVVDPVTAERSKQSAGFQTFSTSKPKRFECRQWRDVTGWGHDP